MQIVEFGTGTLRFLEQIPTGAPESGFLWIYLDREELADKLPQLQQAAQAIGGSSLLDLHVKDMGNPAHPSHYDYTSIYDLVIFRRLATEQEVRVELGEDVANDDRPLAAFGRVRTRALAFVVFDRLLVTVHPAGCQSARSFIQRYLGDVVYSEGLSAAARSRLPSSPADLMLRMVNVMVDSYLELRRALSAEMDDWQQGLLGPDGGAADWGALMTARNALHTLEDLCEEQNDAMQEWLDTQRELPYGSLTQAERDGLMARARDVVEHIQRVVHHVRRMESGAESAVQIHFSAQGHRMNEIMRTLTALTAIFLPLNLIAGVFGMNFDYLPFTKEQAGVFWIVGAMAFIAVALVLLFRRKRYLARTR
ncbi:magnesium transporter CorA family protein [Ramlibacter sp.]|uniref:magnesium transporter CorA family protein n=1 Tax=Ramlibacter sp. TaxID=1917967 RepID=UPI002FCC6B68